MPGIPLLDPHGEGVDILVEKFEQADRLDNRLILPVDVQGDLISGEGVGEAESGLLQLNILEFLMLQEAQEMFADSADELANDGGGGCLDLKGVVDGACQIFLTHSKFNLGLFLEREVLREKIDDLLRCFSGEGGRDDFEGGGGGLEGVECLSVEGCTFRCAMLEKVSKFLIYFCTLSTELFSSSNSLSSKRPYPIELSNSIYKTI
jgi:hypothetical protein